MRTGARVATALALFLVLLPSGLAGQIIPHGERWLAFQTDHFNVSFTEGLEPVARRAAARGEWAYGILSRELTRPPAGRIELVVVDNLDFSNGYASPFPRNRIVVYALPPASEPTLANHDDWLELLLLHELVHVFHFDRSGGIWEPLRGIFGRNPLLFPQIFNPGWVVEGLATYYESSQTGAGRVRGSYFEMMLRTAILEDAFFAIDEATIDPVTWPAASTRYVYGSLFIDHLARTYGPDAVSSYVERFGSNLIPYRVESAARRAFGTTLGSEWRTWRDSLSATYEELADSLARVGLTEPQVLTGDGRYAFHPRFSPEAARIVYSASTGRDDPSHRILTADGRPIADLERTSLGPPSWLADGGGLVYAKMDFEDPYHLRSDVYVSDLDGDERRVTRDARLWEPDAHPDGARAVAVQGRAGSNVLAIVDLVTGEVEPITEPSAETYWASPRWSPDGSRIAAMRWTPDGRFDVAVVDAAGADVSRVTAQPHADLDPTWSPDGRFVLFSSDRTGIPNLFAYELETGRLRQVTNLLTGAFHPDVSSDGEWIAFSLYRSDGFYIARIPYRPEDWRPTPVVQVAEPRAAGPMTGGDAVGSEVRDYSPFPSIFPTSWSPAIGDDETLSLGIALAGEDVVERHLWAVEALVHAEDLRFDWGAAYRYQGWGVPTLDVQAEQQWDRLQIVDAGSFDIRDQEGAVGATWLGRSWNSARWVQAGFEAADVDYFGDSPDLQRAIPVEVGAALGLGYSSVRGFGLSLAPQEGLAGGLRLQGRRYLEEPAIPGVGRDYWRLTGRTRAYQATDWFGFAPPTLALRLDGGIQTADAASGFFLGGSSVAGSGLLIGNWLSGATSTYPLRGYRSGVQHGSRVVAATAEYRFPVWLIERGLGLFPLALDRLWADVFVDAGAAWCPASSCSLVGSPPTEPDPLVAIGAEAILELRAGFLATIPLRFGFGVPLREPGVGEPRGYVQVGRAF